MLELIEKISHPTTPHARLTLPFELRQRARFKTRLDDGTEAGLFLPRGAILHNGDILRARDGTLVQVVAAAEELSIVHIAHARQVARACYHLGNRHIPLQIDATQLCYLRDDVVDNMVAGLGLAVRHARAPFEPEAGAYTHPHRHGC